MVDVNNRIPRTLNPIPQPTSRRDSLDVLADQFVDKLELPRSSNRNKDTKEVGGKAVSKATECSTTAGCKAPTPAPSPVAFKDASPIAQVSPVTQTEQVSPVQQSFLPAEAPIVVNITSPFAQGQTFTHKLPDNQIMAGGRDQVIRVPFKIGGNHHIIETGGLNVANANRVVIQPEAECEDDTFEVRLPQGVGDARGPADVSQQPLIISRPVQIAQKEVGFKEVGFKEVGFKEQGFKESKVAPATVTITQGQQPVTQGKYGATDETQGPDQGGKGKMPPKGGSDTVEDPPAPEPVETSPTPEAGPGNPPEPGMDNPEPTEPAPASTSTFNAYR